MNFHSLSLNEENYILDMELTRMDGTYITIIPKDFISNLNLKFNEVSSLELTIPKYYTNITNGRLEEYLHYDSFDSEMIITLNETHKFIIKNIDIEESIEHGTYKNIKANDLSSLLQKTDCVLIDQTWQIRKDEISASDGVMDEFSKQTYNTWSWSATNDAIRDDIELGELNKYRFLGIESNWLVAFTDTLPNAYNSLFLIDSYNKKVNVVTEDEVSGYPRVFLEMGDFLKSVNIRENKDNYVTRLRVTSSNENIGISSVNPYGNEYVEFYDEKTRNKMSNELQSALARYDILLKEQNLIFLTSKGKLMDIEKRLTAYSELQIQYNEQFKILNAKRTEYFKKPNDFASQILDIANKITELEVLIASNLSNINIDKKNKENVESVMSSIATKLNKETSSDSKGLIFPKELLGELFMFNQCGAYQDSTSLTDDMLYINGLKELKELQTPVEEFDVSDISAFIEAVSCKDGGTWDKVLTMGSLVGLKLKDREMDVRLIEMSYTPTSNALGRVATMSLKFSNKPWVFNDKRTQSSSSKQHGSNNVVFNSAKKWDSFSLGSNYAKQVYEQGLDIAQNWVSGRYQNSTKIYIDSAGVLITDAETEMQSLFLSNGIMAISSDGLKSIRTAVTGDGIISQELIGKIILGQKLIITSENGEDFFIGLTEGESKNKDGFGLQVFNNGLERIFIGLETENGVRQAKFRLTSPDGKKTIIDDKGLLNTLTYTYPLQNVDASSSPLLMKFYIPEECTTLHKVKVHLSLGRYRVFEQGLESGGKSSSYSSNSGGGSTSGNGGSYNEKPTTANISYNSDLNISTSNAQGQLNESPPPSVENWQNHTHMLHRSTLYHWHEVNIDIPTHYHTTPDHSHETVIDTTHNHKVKYGITETGGASSVTLKLDGIDIPLNINSDREIDLSPYMKNNFKGWHILEVKSVTLGSLGGVIIASCFLTA